MPALFQCDGGCGLVEEVKGGSSIPHTWNKLVQTASSGVTLRERAYCQKCSNAMFERIDQGVKGPF